MLHIFQHTRSFESHGGALEEIRRSTHEPNAANVVLFRCQVVISSSFESSVGLAHLAQLAAAADADWAQTSSAEAPLAHGLGTSHWLAADLTHLPLLTAAPRHADADLHAASATTPQADSVPAAAMATSGFNGSGGSGSVGSTAGLPNGIVIDTAQLPVVDGAAATAAGMLSEPVALAPFSQHTTDVRGVNGSYHFSWTAAGLTTAGGAAQIPMAPPSASGLERAAAQPLTVLLHGFLGAPDDWRPIMAGLAAAGRPCVAVGLPGSHGKAIRPHPDAGGLLCTPLHRDDVRRHMHQQADSGDTFWPHLVQTLPSVGLGAPLRLSFPCQFTKLSSYRCTSGQRGGSGRRPGGSAVLSCGRRTSAAGGLFPWGPPGPGTCGAPPRRRGPPCHPVWQPRSGR